MGYRAAMELCEKYVKEHAGNITVQELADMTGYSFYHFCHVFRAYFDMSAGEYVRQCALRRAALDILAGKSITEAAFDAGFSTSAGFSKSFKRQFGMSATQFRKLKISRSYKEIEPKIENRESFSATGYYISPTHADTPEAGAYWFGVDFSNHPHYPVDSSVKGIIGAWMNPDKVSGELKYFLGYVSDDNDAPEGFIKLNAPAAEYAVFNIPPITSNVNGSKELAENIRKVWKYIFDEWLDSSAYIFDESKVCFEFYHGVIAKIYIPVKIKR